MNFKHDNILKNYFLISIIIFSSLGLLAQNIDFIRANFPTEELYQKSTTSIQQGNNVFFKGDFKTALPLFLMAQKLNNSNALLNFKIGVCYYKLDQLEEAHPYFVKARMLDRKIDPKIDYALAKSYQAVENYTKAIQFYQIYLEGLSSGKKASAIKEITASTRYCKEKLQQPIEKDSLIAIISKKEPLKKKVQKEKTSAIKKPTTKKKVLISPNTLPKKEVSYRIQIASALHIIKSDELKRLYNGKFPISHEYSTGRHRYFVGDFNIMNDAKKAQKDITVKGAFIVRFRNGKKI